MTWIVDTSVAVEWAVAEEGADLAASFLGGDVVAPDLLRSELANALWKKVRRNEIDALQAVAGFAAIEDALTFLATDRLAARALDIALAIAHPVYDCLYLALAESTGMRILTADRKLIVNC
ncbi:type II toxin-antitoxin system VapC family toxin [Sphingomonas taxi]|uniref:type II toxin-antitoxin system VapC family toxin n=1 Tax=Sphingomonas taxi TaxID=1549858 RepID=UPI00068CBDDE|nr:type II toxin-antitoxin system VapC family toxin [Sphingomonas taxi]